MTTDNQLLLSLVSYPDKKGGTNINVPDVGKLVIMCRHAKIWLISSHPSPLCPVFTLSDQILCNVWG